MTRPPLSWPSAAACMLALSALTSPSASAAVSGALTFSSIELQLDDLQPLDGHAPAIGFHTNGTDAGVATAIQDPLPFEAVIHLRYGSLDATSLHSSAGHAWARSAIAGGSPDSPAGATMSLGGAAWGVANHLGAPASFAAQATISQPTNLLKFTLSPWTAVVVTFAAHVRLAGGHADDTLTAAGRFNLYGEDGQALADTLDLSCSGVCRLDEKRTMSLTLVNSSAQALDGEWSLFASLDGSTLAPVPEPHPAALLLAGLGTMAALRRRRMRRRARRRTAGLRLWELPVKSAVPSCTVGAGRRRPGTPTRSSR